MSQKRNWKNHVNHPRRKHGVATRSAIENGIRRFFLDRGFLETRTPMLVPCPGMEAHIRPLQVARFAADSQFQPQFLPTSPEFAMKRLLVGGLKRIFQICPAFRDEPSSPTHRQEFTMLEWYRTQAGYEEIMEDTEQLFEALALERTGKPWISYQGKEISVKTPWPRLRIRDLFQQHLGIDLSRPPVESLQALQAQVQKHGLASNLPNGQETWDDLYFKLWLNIIEPRLPTDQAVFVTRYPASQSALAVVDQDPDGSRWAKRFELYAGGLELGNAFEELTDPIEQRRRFEEDMELRAQTYGTTFPKTPIDEEFLDALKEGMPPSGGIAIGVDRMVMLFADEPNIDYTFWI